MSTFSYTSNIVEFNKKHIDRINGLRNGSKIIRRALLDLLALISYRIQNEGEGTEGRLIGEGDYSKGHQKTRIALSLQTSRIDLTLSGDMLDRGLILVPIDGQTFGLALTGAKDNISHIDLMRHFENIYDQEIIQPSEEEKRIVLETIFEEIQSELSS